MDSQDEFRSKWFEMAEGVSQQMRGSPSPVSVIVKLTAVTFTSHSQEVRGSPRPPLDVVGWVGGGRKHSPLEIVAWSP